jgi:hypothetical protein
MGPKNPWRRRKREERGPVKEDPCHARVKARPSWARWRRAAGVTARRLVTKVKTPFFNDLRAMTSLSIRPHFAFIIIVLQHAACRVPSCGAKCKTRHELASREPRAPIRHSVRGADYRFW